MTSQRNIEVDVEIGDRVYGFAQANELLRLSPFLMGTFLWLTVSKACAPQVYNACLVRLYTDEQLAVENLVFSGLRGALQR